MAAVFIGRQPVLDTNLHVWGYELLFRSGTDNQARFGDAGEATSQVIINALFDIGLERLVGDAMALVNLPRDFLVQEHADLLPSARVVLEVLEDVDIDDALCVGVRRLWNAGYTIALDDFAFEPRWEPLLDLAGIIKVEVPLIDPREHARLKPKIAELKQRGVLMLAEKVESEEEFEAYRDLGFDLFQGYFFARPKLVKGSRLPGNRLQTLRLLAELNNDELDTSQVASMVAPNVDLSVKLLRLLNSSRYAFLNTIDSVHQAVRLVGIRQLRALATIVVMTGIDDKPHELIALSLVRARMCECLAKEKGTVVESVAFTVGMLSTLDALLDRPLGELLDELPLTDEVRTALLEGAGPAGQYLQWAIACERMDSDVLDTIDMGPSELGRLYVECMSWARDTLGGLAL